ncbi:MAG: hypothetical protein JW953_17320 [Anaerolineae bacterium]|nr:hypothetical protein [Anaerolineae bacterium]
MQQQLSVETPKISNWSQFYAELHRIAEELREIQSAMINEPAPAAAGGESGESKNDESA